MKHDGHLFIELSEKRYMKLNQSNCHFLVSGHKYASICEQIVEVNNWKSLKQKLLGAVIMRDLSFNGYVSSLYKKASLAEIIKCTELSTEKNLIK